MKKPDDRHPRPWHRLGMAPRDHAHAILAMGKDRERIEKYMEERVPEQYREWVIEYILDWAERERHRSMIRRVR
jgi:hypothetical protein